MFSSNNSIDNADDHIPSEFHIPIYSSQAMQRQTTPIPSFNPITPLPSNSGFYSPPSSSSNTYVPNASTYNKYPSIWYESTLGNGLTYATNDSLLFAQAYHRQRQYEHRGHPYAPIYCTDTMLASPDDEIQAYSNFGYLREIYPRNGSTNYSNVANSSYDRAFNHARPSCTETWAPFSYQNVVGNGNIETRSGFGSTLFSPKQVSGGYFSHDSNSIRITSVNGSYSPFNPHIPVNISPSLHSRQENGQNNQSGNEAKENTTITNPPKKKRGRKPKPKYDNANNEMVVSIPGGTALFTVALAPIKRKRGRPRKPNPALFFPVSAMPAPVATERYKRDNSPNSNSSVIDDPVPGPSSTQVANDSDIQAVGRVPNRPLRMHTAEADKSEDELINVTSPGAASSGHTSPVVHIYQHLIETSGQSNTEERIDNLDTEDIVENNAPNECVLSHNAPPEIRDHGHNLTAPKAKILKSTTKTQMKNRKRYANKKGSKRMKGRLNFISSKPVRKNQLKRRKKIKKRNVPSSKSAKSTNDKKVGLIDDHGLANKSNLTLNDTSGTKSNLRKPKLDMPNIFDVMGTSAPPPNQTDQNDQQSENLSDLEEMINVHIYGNDVKKSERPAETKIRKICSKAQCTSVKEPTRVANSSTTCFLSDVSNEETNLVERHTNTDSIKECSSTDNLKPPSSSKETRSSPPQNVINETLPISEPINYFPNVNEQSNSLNIEVENSTTKTVNPLNGFNSQSGNSNQNNVNQFGLRQYYFHASNEKHINASQDIDSASGMGKNVGRIFGTFNSKQNDIVETVTPQTNTFETTPFPQYRDPTMRSTQQTVDNMKTPFTSLWEDIIKFNEEEAGFGVHPNFATNLIQVPSINANPKAKSIKHDEYKSAFVKVCKLPSPENRQEPSEKNNRSDFDYEEGEIFSDAEREISPAAADFVPCVHSSKSFFAGHTVVHDCFGRPPDSPSYFAPITTRGWCPFVDHDHSNISQGSGSARTDFLGGHALGSFNSLHGNATSNCSYSEIKNLQNNDESNSVVSRILQNMSTASNGDGSTVKTTQSQGADTAGPGVKYDGKRLEKSYKTHPMIKKLIKFTNKPTCTNSVNKTKSKLNADLSKVFILGKNKPRISPFFAETSTLKEVMLEIPRPWEPRARNTEPANEKIAQNNDKVEKKAVRCREIAKKKIADQLTPKGKPKRNKIRKLLGKKTQIRTTTGNRKRSIRRKSSKPEHQQVGMKQYAPKSYIQMVNENDEITKTVCTVVQSQQNEVDDFDEEMVDNTEVQPQQNEFDDFDEEMVDNKEVQTQENGDIEFNEDDDDDILKIHAERDILLDLL